MARTAGGTKRSSWLTFRRRLLLVRLLLRRPASRDDLIAAVNGELGENGYPDAAASALKHDLDALKDEFGCRIRFLRTDNCYALEDLGDLALLDLPDTSLEALAFLESSFPRGSELPEHAKIGDLLDRILLLLPEQRRVEHRSARSALRLQLGDGSARRVDPGLLAAIKRAIKGRCELLFEYNGAEPDGLPRRHRVAPYGIAFRAEGHAYLDATVLDVQPPGLAVLHSAVDYRLDRIIQGSVHVLPQMLPPERLRPPTYTLRYRLLPAAARRRDVATYFPESRVSYHDDGSATVTAAITNIWQARQILLRYGSGCIVEEPPELVAKFREAARDLSAIYNE